MDQPLTAYTQSSGETLCGRRSPPVLPLPSVSCRQSRPSHRALVWFLQRSLPLGWRSGRKSNTPRVCSARRSAGYGIRITQDENEYMPAGQSLGVSNGGVPQFVIIALCPNQTWAGRLVEGQPELGLWHGVHHRLVHVLRSFDEVRLADNNVGIFRELHPNRFKLDHGVLSASR